MLAAVVPCLLQHLADIQPWPAVDEIFDDLFEALSNFVWADREAESLVELIGVIEDAALEDKLHPTVRHEVLPGREKLQAIDDKEMKKAVLDHVIP